MEFSAKTRNNGGYFGMDYTKRRPGNSTNKNHSGNMTDKSPLESLYSIRTLIPFCNITSN